MQQLAVIGIDSLDPVVLSEYRDRLPHLSKLMDGSPGFRLKSVFPVDSIPAWISIYTGLNPGKHRVVKTYDIFDKSQADILKIGTGAFQGHTFWDYASNAGKKVCVIYPFMAYPPWEVNGIMLSKSVRERKVAEEKAWTVESELESCPPTVMGQFNIPRSIKGVFGSHPGPKNLTEWADDAKKAILDEARYSLQICRETPWDLFFSYFSWLDIVQHRLWRYFDAKDPSYPGHNPLSNIIPDFYQLVDSIIGDFMDLYTDIPLIVLSDHGHGIRPTKTVNLNKVLIDHGVYYSGQKRSDSLRYVIEKLKVLTLEISNRFNLDYWLVEFSTKNKTLSGLSKDIYMSSLSAQKSNYLACLSAFAGVKSYSHGGIEVNKNCLPDDATYEEIRSRIVDLLSGLQNPRTGERLFEWVKLREDLYASSESAIYPDIVFQLKDEYGTGWNLHDSLIGKAYDHNLASGGHKRDAVFLTSNIDRAIERNNMTLMDVAPTILDLIDVKTDVEFDGTSVFT